MRKINDLFHSKFKGKWSVLADGHYTLLSTIWKRSNWICPKRNSKKNPFSSSEKKMNTRQKKTRSRIERVFSVLTQTWKCLENKWRSYLKQHQLMIFLVCSIYNKKLMIQ